MTSGILRTAACEVKVPNQSTLTSFPGIGRIAAMFTRANRVYRAISKALARNDQDHVTVGGSIIPSPDLRWCGQEFKDDSFYLASAEREARRLVDHYGMNRRSRLLDVGCGQGRLAIGILRVLGELPYLGIDIDRRSVEWCRRHIQRYHPSFTFVHQDVYNERYNTAGKPIDGGMRLATTPESIDIVYLFSVFSHTTEEDMRVYLGDFQRVLRRGGRVFFTTFVEEDVPDITINPENYRLRCSGPLHIVRYRKDYLFAILAELGYEILDFTHATEADGQSAIYLRSTER